MRIALGVEYDGGDFHGWETQSNGRTVQATLERALATVADAPVATVCAGRTDAGVHARAQVVHFDTEARREPRAWVMGANSNLPEDVAVRWALEVPDDFHARFSARCRRYRYVIANTAARPALARGQAAWEHRPLDAGRMSAAAGHLLGEHDFSAFRAAGCQARRPVRTVYALDVVRRGERIVIDVAANAFLHHMVRNIVGTLLDVGTGRREPAWAAEVLAARDRTRGGVTAPARGLCLVGVDYPARFRLPAVPREEALW